MPNNSINSDVQKRRFALLLHAGYGERSAVASRRQNGANERPMLFCRENSAAEQSESKRTVPAGSPLIRPIVLRETVMEVTREIPQFVGRVEQGETRQVCLLIPAI